MRWYYLQTLNATSKQFDKQRALLQEVLAGTDQDTALLFVKGSSREMALENNEKFAEQLKNSLATAELFPSAHAKDEHINNWKKFWTEEKRSYVQKQIQTQAQKLGIAPQAFAPFFNFLTEEPTEDTFDFAQIYNPLIELPHGGWAVVNMVKNSPEIVEAAQQVDVVLVAGAALQQELLQAVRKEAFQIVLWALLCNLLAVSLLFHSFKKALLAFVPVLLAAGFTFACFWILQIEVNLFVLVFLPLLIGLGIDYGIFQLVRNEAGPGATEAYVPQALWTAALSTLAGFGVLIFAQHGVLFSMGLSSFLGVGSAVVAAQFILPALLEEKSK